MSLQPYYAALLWSIFAIKFSLFSGFISFNTKTDPLLFALFLFAKFTKNILMDILLVNKINSAADKLIIIDRRFFSNINGRLN